MGAGILGLPAVRAWVRALGAPGDQDDEDGGPDGGGGGPSPPRRPPPVPPVDWPEFERRFAEYAARRPGADAARGDRPRERSRATTARGAV